MTMRSRRDLGAGFLYLLTYVVALAVVGVVTHSQSALGIVCVVALATALHLFGGDGTGV